MIRARPEYDPRLTPPPQTLGIANPAAAFAAAAGSRPTLGLQDTLKLIYRCRTGISPRARAYPHAHARAHTRQLACTCPL